MESNQLQMEKKEKKRIIRWRAGRIEGSIPFDSVFFYANS